MIPRQCLEPALQTCSNGAFGHQKPCPIADHAPSAAARNQAQRSGYRKLTAQIDRNIFGPGHKMFANPSFFFTRKGQSF